MDSADSSNKTWSVKFRVPLSIKPINSFQNKLPIINTLNDLMRSGDKIRRIEAVLSKTLNFNNYDGSRSFSTVVKGAGADVTAAGVFADIIRAART